MGILDNTIGAVFIASTISTVLYGVTLMQSLTYFQSFPADRTVIKCMVAAILMLDTLHTIFATHAIYVFVITNFTNIEALLEIPWSISALILATDIQDTAVRLFFIYRIWHLSGKNRFITISLVIAVILLFVDEFAFFVKTCLVSMEEQVEPVAWLLYAGFGLSVFADTFIAVLLSYLLLKSRTGVRRTTSLLNTLTVYTINTGLLISVDSLCILIAYATMPHNYVFLAFFVPLSKLFVNSFLATLNVRAKLREGTSRKEFGSFSISKLPGSASDGTGRTSATTQGERFELQTGDAYNSAPKINNIRIEKEIIQNSDGSSSIEIVREDKGMSVEETV